jgi:putative addiction module component (TIGR02574 family)
LAASRTIFIEPFTADHYHLFMPLTIDQLEQEAMRLSATSRAALAEKLVQSLDAVELDEVQKRWVAEALRRRDEVRSGRAKPIPGEQVLDEARRRAGR